MVSTIIRDFSQRGGKSNGRDTGFFKFYFCWGGGFRVDRNHVLQDFDAQLKGVEGRWREYIRLQWSSNVKLYKENWF